MILYRSAYSRNLIANNYLIYPASMQYLLSFTVSEYIMRQNSKENQLDTKTQIEERWITNVLTRMRYFFYDSNEAFFAAAKKMTSMRLDILRKK